MRKRVHGLDSGDSDVEDVPTAPKKSDLTAPAVEETRPVKGLMSMKFMQKTTTPLSATDDYHNSDDELEASQNPGRIQFGELSSKRSGFIPTQPGVSKTLSKKTSVANVSSEKLVPVSLAQKNEDQRQRDLIEMAFALDDVVEKEFEEEKEAMEKGHPEKNGELPGWGHWAGCGVAQRKAPIVEPAKPARTASKMKHIIINDQRDKKFAAKYLTPQVPFPYQSRDQYEAMTRAPIGKEWNTVNTHKKLVKPRVATKSGAVINPIKFTSQPKDAKKSS